MPKNASVSLLTDQTSTTTLTAVKAHEPWCNYMTFQARGSTSAGAGSATIEIRVSNDNVDYTTLAGTITLTLSTTVVGDGFASLGAWRYVKAHVSALSGTGASVTVTMGVYIP